MHKHLFIVGDLGRTPAEPRDKPTAQKKAPTSTNETGANTAEAATLWNNLDNDIAAGEPEMPAISEVEWEAAFPGQRVLHRRVPNRQRLAMRFAQGMVRAVNRGDYSVAVVFFNRLHNIPRKASGGAS